MRKLVSAIGILSITSFVVLLIGYFILNWKVTTVIPFSVVSLILFFNWLSIFTIKTKLIQTIGFSLFFIQVVILSLFLFEVIEMTSIWKWMFLILIGSYLLFLHDLILRFSTLSNKRIVTITSLILFFSSLCLSFLYLQNKLTNNFIYISIIVYSLFSLLCIWTSKKQVL